MSDFEERTKRKESIQIGDTVCLHTGSDRHYQVIDIFYQNVVSKNIEQLLLASRSGYSFYVQIYEVLDVVKKGKVKIRDNIKKQSPSPKT